MVSAIITTYKRPPEIVERAAQSVLSQTYKDIELIIVDDSPETYEQRSEVCYMAQSLGERVKYIPHEKNLGACAARNTGIKNAKGEFVAFLDDDDEWLPEKIEKQLYEIEKDANTALVYCSRYVYFVSEGEERIDSVTFFKGNIYEKLILNNFIGSTSFTLIRRSVLDELGGFNVEMKAAQDYEMWLRIAEKYSISYIDKPLVRYYVHEGEQITKNHKVKMEALERINELNSDYLKKHPKAYSIRIARMVVFQAKFDVKKAKKNFWKAVMLWPFPTKDLLRAFKWAYIMPVLNKKG